MLLLLTALLEKVVSCLGLLSEVHVIGEEKLEVDSLLVEEHTGNDWSGLITEGSLNGGVDAVADECLSLFALESIELLDINWRKLKLLRELLHLVLLHWSAWLTWSWWLWHSWSTLVGLVDVILLISTLTLLVSALVIVVVASSALASSTASIATSTSVVWSVTSLVLTISAMILISTLVASVVRTWSVVEILLTPIKTKI